jgi:hypothetical protein
VNAPACTPLFGHHSTDRVTYWHGTATPAILCGRHAAYLTPADIVAMRDAGTITNTKD